MAFLVFKIKAKMWLIPLVLSLVALALGLYNNSLFSTAIGCSCVGYSLAVIVSHNLYMRNWMREDYGLSATSLPLTGVVKGEMQK